jgi:hypothetical protein
LDERPAQRNMNEEKKDKKTEILGIIAIVTAGLCWLCVLGAIPFEFIYLLPVSTIAVMLSLKNILSKMAMALLVLLAPGYLVINYASLAPAL